MEGARSVARTRGTRPLGTRLRSLGRFVLYLLMLVAILALWNDDAPQFIYVAF